MNATQISLIVMLWASTAIVWILDYLDKRPLGSTAMCSRGALMFTITITIHIGLAVLSEHSK